MDQNENTCVNCGAEQTETCETCNGPKCVECEDSHNHAEDEESE